MLGGSVSLGLAKSSDSIREARLGGLHSGRQARAVGEFPEVVAWLYLCEKWRRFMLPWGKGWGGDGGEGARICDCLLTSQILLRGARSHPM